MVIRTTGQCSFCRQVLLQRPFVAFICRHFFHRDCLETKIKVIFNFNFIIYFKEKSNEYANLDREERLLMKEFQLATIGRTNPKTKKMGVKERDKREGKIGLVNQTTSDLILKNAKNLKR